MRCLSDVRVDATDELVSFDVKALYTSLPLTCTIDVVHKRLQEDDSCTHYTPLQTNHILQLLELCLKSTYFSFQNRFYLLKDGVAIYGFTGSVGSG